MPIVQCLLSAGAAVDPAARDGSSPLHIAARGGHLLVVETLVEAGAAVDHARLDGCGTLHIAAHKGHADVARCLIAAGATIDQSAHTVDQSGHSRAAPGVGTPLHVAVTECHHWIVELLVAAHATTCDEMMTFCRHNRDRAAHCRTILELDPALLRPWTPRAHAVFPAGFRDGVLRLALCWGRRELPAGVLIDAVLVNLGCDWFARRARQCVRQWPPTELVAGDVATVVGVVSQPHLNGQQVRLLRYLPHRRRFTCKFQNDKSASLRVANVQKRRGPAPPTSRPTAFFPVH